MTVKHFPPFAFTSTSPFSIHYDVDGSVGLLNLSGTFYHCISASIEGTTYRRFDQYFESEWNAAHAQTPVTVSYNATEAKYYIFNNTLTASIVFQNSASAQTMGFSNSFVSYSNGGTLLTSSVSCYYQYTTRLSDRSNWSDVTEDTSKTRDVVADDGTAYSFGKTGTELFDSWDHVYEFNTNMSTRYALASTPWTWMRNVNHISSILPWFIVSGTNGNVSGSQVREIYKLQADSARYNPVRSIPNYYKYWNINIRARLVLSASVSGSTNLFVGLGS